MSIPAAAVSGMGFFADAYDLFVIGIVVSLIETEWRLSTNQVSWLNSATLLASAFGAIIFGRVADILGRKRIYGYEVLGARGRSRLGGLLLGSVSQQCAAAAACPVVLTRKRDLPEA